MTPQLVDLDADGYQDMLVATFEGTAFLMKGSEKGWAKPEHIKDEDDTNVRISFYWDLDKDDYQSVDRSSEDYDSVDEHHMTSIAAVDWDHDGDLDLILGAYEGALYRCMNIGSKTEPKFESINHQIMAGDKPFNIKSLSTPRVVDWDQDGLWDLLVGTSDGEIHFLRNEGKQGQPEFKEAQLLLDIKRSSVDKFPVGDVTITGLTRNAHMEALDYDGDGDLDLLVGAHTTGKAEEKSLSDEEKEELDELKDQQKELSKQLSKIYEASSSREEAQKLKDNPEFKEVSDKYRDVYEKIRELQPTVRPPHLIWLYRNKAKDQLDEKNQSAASDATS